jgi:hypothetical protein
MTQKNGAWHISKCVRHYSMDDWDGILGIKRVMKCPASSCIISKAFLEDFSEQKTRNRFLCIKSTLTLPHLQSNLLKATITECCLWITIWGIYGYMAR